MAKTAMKLKQQRKPKFSTQAYTRCNICGRPHSVLRKYGICRLCFRDLAYKGQIPGVKKASWQDVGKASTNEMSICFQHPYIEKTESGDSRAVAKQPVFEMDQKEHDSSHN